MIFSDKCKGFTLIELLAVVVIMGVLAAVAIPKVFGQIAKARASELYSAAGTYIHLQDSYNIQYHDSIGTWVSIGYKPPVSNSFKYFEDNTEGGITSTTAFFIDAGETAAWKAQNISDLNDCNARNSWQLDVSKSTNSAYNIVYKVVISDPTCEALTKKFDALDTYNKITATP